MRLVSLGTRRPGYCPPCRAARRAMSPQKKGTQDRCPVAPQLGKGRRNLLAYEPTHHQTEGRPDAASRWASAYQGTGREGNSEGHGYTSANIGPWPRLGKYLDAKKSFRTHRPLLPARVSAILIYRWLVPRQAPPAERTHDPLPPALTGGAPWADLSSIPHPTIQIP